MAEFLGGSRLLAACKKKPRDIVPLGSITCVVLFVAWDVLYILFANHRTLPNTSKFGFSPSITVSPKVGLSL